MKKLALILGVLSLVACTDQKVVNYNTARLDNIEAYLANNKAVKPSENLRRRAEAVKAKLIEFGLPEDRIVGIEAKGEEYPVATNETPEGRLQNRRVEFRLVQR